MHNRIRFKDDSLNAVRLLCALFLVLAGIGMIIVGVDRHSWPQVTFGFLAWLAGVAIVIDLVAWRKKSSVWDGPYHDETSNRLYYVSKIAKTSCLLCGKGATHIIHAITGYPGMIPGSECPECGPVFSDLYRGGFYYLDAVAVKKTCDAFNGRTP